MSKEAQAYSKRYQKHQRHEDLTWLAENYLKVGITKKEILSVLGENYSRSQFGMTYPDGIVMMDEPEPESLTWIYLGNRDLPYGHYLLIHYNNLEDDALVESWEWVSE